MTTICISQVSIQGQWESLQFLTYDCAKNCWIPSCPWGDPYSQSKIQIGINHNIHTPALLLRTLREAPFWNMLVLYGHCQNSFRPPPPSTLSNGQTWTKKCPKPSWEAFTPPPLGPYVQCHYGNNTFQKGVSLTGMIKECHFKDKKHWYGLIMNAISKSTTPFLSSGKKNLLS